jgi:ubiquinone biosynthesis protein
MDKETIKRLGEIRSAMKKYGFDKILGQTARNRLSPLRDEESSELLLDNEIPEKLRLMLQELGTTFIKLGQLLSTRPDVVGEKIATELAKLQDDNPAVSFEEVKEIIEEELKGDINKLFKDFSKEPLATASIGQVHEAVLPEGERVAIKIQKKGITDKIDLDLNIMKFIAMEADKFNPQIKKINLPGVMDEFDRTIHKEIDYFNELMNMKRFEANFEGQPNIHVPISYEDYSTSKVLTMEFIAGAKLSDVYESDSQEYDKKLLADYIVRSYFQQIFIDGFFHGDPHPGNLMILEENVVCYLDLGMVGVLNEDFKRDLAELLILFSDKDIDGLINQFIYMDILDDSVDTKNLKRDIEDLFGRYFGVKLNHFNGILDDLLSVMQSYNVILPNEFVTMARGVSMIEAIAQNLDPEIDVFIYIQPVAKQLAKEKMNPKKFLKNKKNSFIMYEHMLKSLPKLLSRTMRKIERGELIFKIEVDRIDKMTNKIVLFLFASALIIGSSLVMTIDKGPLLFDMPLFGAIGFILSFIIVLYTIIQYMIKV